MVYPSCENGCSPFDGTQGERVFRKPFVVSFVEP
jgi:hypothetical protein